tara:strand:+ start:2801 stop:3046 length:246 start_codon:yes stop_codon:yes gene_type:complete
VARSGPRCSQVLEKDPEARKAHVGNVSTVDLDTVARESPEHTERHGDAVVVMTRNSARERMITSFDFKAITQLFSLHTHGS